MLLRRIMLTCFITSCMVLFACQEGGGAGSTGPSDGGAGSTGSIDCSMVGCAAPPLCETGCTEPCGCCSCSPGQVMGGRVCVGGCYAADAGTGDGGLDDAG